MKASEINQLTDDELRVRQEDASRELFNLRIQQTTGQLENPLRLRFVRREIARIQTAIHQRAQKEIAS